MEFLREAIAFVWSLFSKEIPLGDFSITLGAIMFFAIGIEIIIYLAESFFGGESS